MLCQPAKCCLNQHGACGRAATQPHPVHRRLPKPPTWGLPAQRGWQPGRQEVWWRLWLSRCPAAPAGLNGSSGVCQADEGEPRTVAAAAVAAAAAAARATAVAARRQRPSYNPHTVVPQCALIEVSPLPAPTPGPTPHSPPPPHPPGPHLLGKHEV